MSVENCFTERQLKILQCALAIAIKSGSLAAKAWDIDMLVADIEDLLQFEREAKRERKRSLAIERKAVKS